MMERTGSMQMRSHPEKKRGVDEPSDAEEDAFLDRMTGLLDAIVRECAAIGRTEDAGAVLAKAATAFEGVQRMCREAGIVHANAVAREASKLPTKGHTINKNAATRVVPVRTHKLRKQGSPIRQMPDPFAVHDRSTSSLDLDLQDDEEVDDQDDEQEQSEYDDQSSLPPLTPMRRRLPHTSGDDMIEVEITDILTSTQEEIQRWKHEFRLQMMEQQTQQHDQNRMHMEQIQSLRETLDESQRHIAKMHKEIHDTNTKLEAMQALTTTSQRAMELTLKEHTQYWKAICHDLVVEKRTIAKKLAEERGKYHSLREHIDMHDMGGKATPELRRSSPPSSPGKRAKRTTAISSSSLLGNPASTASSSSRHRDSTSSSMYASGSASSPPSGSNFRRYYMTKKPSS